MAAKVNVKFILILFAGLVLAGGTLGGLYVLQVRGDATRNLRRGDEAMAALEQAGDDQAQRTARLREALDFYGRAVYKEPGNLEYLRKMESALVQLRPRTAEEANELYTQYMGVLQHAPRYHPQNVDLHLRLLRELHLAARRANVQPLWEMLAGAAGNMRQHLSESDPQRHIGTVYQSLARYRLAQLRTDEELVETGRDLDQAVAAMPEDDLAWSALISGQIAILEKNRKDASRTALEEQSAKIDQAVEQALKSVPRGPETAKLALLRAMIKRNFDRAAVDPEAILQARQHLLDVLTPDSNPALIVESAQVIAFTPDNGRELAVDLLQRMLDKHPEAHDARIALAQFQYLGNELDQAERTAQAVIEAPQLPVSFLAQFQFELRRQAASTIVDVEHRRWETAAPAERAAQLKKVEQARDRLAAIVTDAASDRRVTRAEAKIAYSKGEINRAASLFDDLARDAGAADAEVLIYAADCLERLGMVGRAHERVASALRLQPANAYFMAAKARLEVVMGQFDAARATMTDVPADALAIPNVRQVMEAINAGPQGDQPTSDDPVQIALASAQASLNKGETDAAKATLAAALNAAPDNLRLLLGLAQVEMRSGQADKAREYVARGLALEPEHVMFKRLEATLKYDDPIEATREYQIASIPDESTRAVVLMANMAAIARRHEAEAARLEAAGKPEDAAKAKDIATRAKAEANSWAEAAEKLVPESPQVVEFRFDQAATAKDWPAVERIVSRAKTINADQANGLVYQGRYEAMRGNFGQAVQTLESATDRLGYSASTWRALAYAYQSLGNTPQALRAYEQAYRCNPNDLDGVKSYINLLLRSGDQTRALRILQSAHRLAPYDQQMRDSWLDLEAAVGDRTLALRERRRIDRETPDDASNAKHLVRLLSDTQPAVELLLDDNGERLVGEQHWARLSVPERERMLNDARQEWNQQSNAILDRLSAQEGDTLDIAVLRSAMLRARGDVAGGENALREFIARRSDAEASAAMYMELARYQARTSHYREAIATYEEAIKRQDAQSPDGYLELGQLYMQLGLHEQALAHLDQAQAIVPAPATQNQAIECLIKIKKFDEAEKRLAESLKGRSPDVMSMMLQASVAEGRGNELLAKGDAGGAERKFNEQREALARAETLDPGTPTPRILLATSLLAEYQRTQRRSLLDDALMALDKADRIRAGTIDVSLIRVAVLKAQGDTAAAMNELRRLLERVPDHIPARRDLMQMYVEAKDADSATRLIDDAIRVNPTMSIWHETKGDLIKHTTRDAKASIEAYRKAFDLSPSTLVLLKLVDASFAASPPDCKAIADLLAARSAEVEAEPLLREFNAKALMCLEQREQALEQLRLSYTRRKALEKEGRALEAEIAPWFVALKTVFTVEQAAEAEQFALEQCQNQPNLHEQRYLARIWIQTGAGGASRAIELQEQAIQRAPADDKALRAALYMELANYLLMSGRYADAAATYEIVLQNHPEHAEAANNLAFLLAEYLGDPAKAVPYAQRAAALAPRDASVLDTVGYVYFKAGDNQKARQYLGDSLGVRPIAITHLHMAEVLWKVGEPEGALQHIGEARKLNPDRETLQKLDQLQDDIQKNRTPKP